MKRLSTVVFIIALTMMIKSNAQDINFPTGMTAYDAKPDSALLGQVKTVMTVSYKGEEVTNSVVETYDLQKRKQEYIYQHAGIEIHSGKMVSLEKKEIYIYDSKNGRLSKILYYDVEGELINRKNSNMIQKGVYQNELAIQKKMT